MTQPLLSVIIPTWNRSNLVCEAIESALIQRSEAIEIIVVDDASTDNTSQKLKENFGSRIMLVQSPERLGVGAARNVGITLASGQLISFLDSDDLWLPGKLEAEIKAFETFPSADAVISDSVNFLEGRPRDKGTRFDNNGLLKATRGKTQLNAECPWLWTNSENGVATCSITLRRSALRKLGTPLFAEDLISCEDWELEVRLYQQCSVVVIPEVWSHVRCFNDHSRTKRATPGLPPSPSQHIQLLRDRLAVIERSIQPRQLNQLLSAELTRFRSSTIQQLEGYQESKFLAQGSR